jgi:hypothetical protein
MNLITVLYIMVSGVKMDSERVKAFKYGKMVASTMVTGKMIELTVMGD